MEKLDKIPNNILMELPLSSKQEKIFIDQINRYNLLSEKDILTNKPMFSDDGRLMFREETIIHGIGSFNYDKLEGISKNGILTGQALGISEDAETYYCADFHRVKEDIIVSDYNTWFSYNDGRCPFGKRADISSSVAFVVEPMDESRELLSYDCYRNSLEGFLTSGFVNSMPLEDNKEIASSILYGVPSNCLCGIIVGSRVLNDKDKINYLISKFSNCYIADCYGKVIYNPYKKEVTIEEYTELSREASVNDSFRRLNDKLLKEKDYKIEKLENENRNLMKIMLQVLSNDDIRQVLMGIGWQSVSDQYIDNMRKGIKK